MCSVHASVVFDLTFADVPPEGRVMSDLQSIASRSRARPVGRSKAAAKARMLRTLCCDDSYEAAARATGAVHIAGVDEVGRGALFGPVVAAAVILPAGVALSALQAAGLRDSKQLDASTRERLACQVRACAIAVAVAEIDAATIDRINIYQATRLAMVRAVTALSPAADHLLVDALKLDADCTQTSIVYGDSRSLSIAAASVVAKVYRDAAICALHQQFPVYGLEEHKGYGTPTHQRALLRHGPSPLHRYSFRPVRTSALPWDAASLEKQTCSEQSDFPDELSHNF